jgi:hypothetical protein
MLKRNLGRDISEMLNNEVIPDMLNFTLEPKDNFDWSKLNYEDYKTPEYYASKLPNGWQSIAGFDKVFEDMAKNAKSPLEEMIDRKLESDKANAEWQPIESFDHIFQKILISKED